MSTATTAKHKTNPVIEGLQTLLADTYSLMAQTQFAHWNIEGPAFFQLHAAFQAQYEEHFAAVDEVAERLRALDIIAPGGLNTLAKASQIEEMEPEPARSRDILSHLIEAQEILLNNAFRLRDASGDSDDLETQDLVIGRIQAHQKQLWMLKASQKNL